MCFGKSSLTYKVKQENMLERFLSYVKIESQSIDEPDMSSFPMTEGQKTIAQQIYNEVKGFGGKNVKVTLSDDYYVYIDIPSNIKKKVPSILFLAHLDVTPEAPGKGIKPIVHRNYDGGEILLPAGITLSPNTPQGAHLKELKGKTIVTSDGSTLLGADDKTGCAVLITMVEELIKNPKFKHGRVMVALSQNEDVGKAALKYEPAVFGEKPDVVIDVDGDTYDQFSVANFSAIGQSYYFKGNKAHPSHGKENKYADALTAAAYFIGLVPPELNPSASEGTQGYVHCYSMTHPLDGVGKPITSDYVVKVRLRYFAQSDGDYQKQLVTDNLRKAQEAFPFVEIKKTDDQMQYENVGYSMPDYVPALIQKAAHDAGMDMREKYARGGTTSAMMVARFPEAIPGGSDFYSGQNAEHSQYEWCCIEEMLQLVNVVENMIKDLTDLNIRKEVPSKQASIQKELLISLFSKALNGTPLSIPYLEESDSAYFLIPVSDDDKKLCIDRLYFVDGTQKKFDYDRDIYQIDSIRKKNGTYYVMVSRIKSKVKKEFEIDGLLLHDIYNINKNKADYKSNICIPIIVDQNQ